MHNILALFKSRKSGGTLILLGQSIFENTLSKAKIESFSKHLSEKIESWRESAKLRVKSKNTRCLEPELHFQKQVDKWIKR